ncbi:MAG: FAD-binding oxidoreductase [Candidatus Dormibacteria bacterium]
MAASPDDRAAFLSRLDRRQFLGRALATGAALALPGCAGPAAGAPSARATPAAGPSPITWAQFRAALAGQLFTPADGGYAVAAQTFNPRFDRVRPAGVVRCAGESDVQRSIDFARTHALPIAMRSGGHSPAGYSTGPGLVIDLSGLRTVSVEPATGAVISGAGARLVDVYSEVAGAGLALPAGSCPTVGIAGLTLGGGVGVLMRRLGLTCDRLSAVRMVTADAVLHEVDASRSPDLFWACRGAGGGNFGVATQLTLEAAPQTPLALFTLHYPWAAVTSVVPAWVEWVTGAPDELWSNCLLEAGPSGDTTLVVNGVFSGDEPGMQTQLADLRRLSGADPSGSSTGSHGFMDTMLIEGGCGGLSVDQCHLATDNPAGVLGREAAASASDLVDRPLGDGGILALVSVVEERHRTYGLAGGAAILDAWGGAAGRVDPAATAFAHRKAVASIQYAAPFSDPASPDVTTANLSWLAAAKRAMQPFVSGAAYQNYMDPGQPDWARAYYGANLPRLQSVKRSVDPDNVFRFEQGINPA